MYINLYLIYIYTYVERTSLVKKMKNDFSLNAYNTTMMHVAQAQD